MKIYLKNRLLIQSTIFPEGNRVYGSGEQIERNWIIYTFNSEEKLTYIKKYSKEDLKQESNLVRVCLDSYENVYGLYYSGLIKLKSIFKIFENMNIPYPDHRISIGGSNCEIYTPFSIIKKLTGVLEKNGVDCLVSNCATLLFPYIFYESPNIERQRKNPIEIKLE